jgi:2-polyprenyl-3-methyl-5-hydroxy-6-metoxy-1,4-benzoquinol methylase
MPNCCYPDEYRACFTPGAARRSARRYLRRGLTGTARQLADEVTAAGIDRATILEVGGGVGDLHAELLRRGAERAVTVDLSPSWESAAASLLSARGLHGRVERLVGDAVDLGEQLETADVVVLHRVICCYPDWRAIVEVAAGHARRAVGFTLPADRPANRAAIATGNALLRLGRRRFRAFVHPVDAILDLFAEHGFGIRVDRTGLVWRTVVVERDA